MLPRLLLGIGIAVALVGCKPPIAPPVAGAPKIQQPRILGGIPDPAPNEGETPFSAPAPQAQANAGSPAEQKPIKLSLGTHLPQTGPEGLIILFSVEYSLQGELNPGAQYVWGIHRNRGNAAEQRVTLQSDGTLTGVQSWQVEDAPYESWIEERTSSTRREVSNRVPML